jgi:hypothetical protein
MPRSLVSSLFAVVVLAVLATGCGGAREPFYTAEQVQAAFLTQGIPLYGRDQIIDRDSTVAPRPVPVREPTAEPLTALLRGLSAVALGPMASRQTRATTLRAFQLDVFVYPRQQDARRRAADLSDLLEAQRILGRVGFHFRRQGNVVATYRTYYYERGVPGFLGARARVRRYDGQVDGRVAAAFAKLP